MASRMYAEVTGASPSTNPDHSQALGSLDPCPEHGIPQDLCPDHGAPPDPTDSRSDSSNAGDRAGVGDNPARSRPEGRGGAAGGRGSWRSQESRRNPSRIVRPREGTSDVPSVGIFFFFFIQSENFRSGGGVPYVCLGRNNLFFRPSLLKFRAPLFASIRTYFISCCLILKNIGLVVLRLHVLLGRNNLILNGFCPCPHYSFGLVRVLPVLPR